MSSTAIYGQIQSCQSQIDACSEEIRMMQLRLENRYALEIQYGQKKSIALENLETKKSKADRIIDFAQTSKLASKYESRVGEKAQIRVVTEKQVQLERVHVGIRTAIKEDEEALNVLQQQFRRLQNQLATLNDEYNSALAREAEDAARAAQEAQAASTKNKS